MLYCSQSFSMGQFCSINTRKVINMNDKSSLTIQPTIENERLTLRKLDLLLRTGCILVENAADTSRIIRNMKRVAMYLCLPIENLHIYVNYNMLMVNLSNAEKSYTKFQRVDKHVVNLDAIRKISHLSWDAIRRNYSLEEYEQQLREICYCKNNYTPWQVAIGAGLACGGFCIQFGCDWIAFFYASIAAILGLRLRMFLNSIGSNSYVNIGVAAFVSTLLAWIFGLISTHLDISFLTSSTPWHPLLACALFIVPGVPLINFVSDMLAGYTQVGITRATNTLLMLLAMAFGIAFAIRFCGIDNFVHDLSMIPHHSYNEYMLAAAISAIGFSMIFNVPRHMMLFVALGGIIAVCTRNFVNLGPSTNNIGLDLGPIVGAFAGSAIISIICCFMVRRLHTPHQCLSIPSVIPMIPGVLMYRALFAFINIHGVIGEVTIAVNNAIHASLIILFIALGVAIPNVFFRRMINPKREQKLMNLLLLRKNQLDNQLSK